MLLSLRATEDQTDWLVFGVPPLVFFQPREVQIHLTLVGSRQCAEFECNAPRSFPPSKAFFVKLTSLSGETIVTGP